MSRPAASAENQLQPAAAGVRDVMHLAWPTALSFRTYLAAAGLSLPSGERDELKGAVDVVGGTVFAGTTRQGSGERVSSAHWVAFVPDTVTLPAPR